MNQQLHRSTIARDINDLLHNNGILDPVVIGNLINERSKYNPIREHLCESNDDYHRLEFAQYLYRNGKLK